MLNAIAKPFGILLLWLNNLIGNYGVAIFLFALVVKLILLPFQMKSKKSMMRMSALSPQVAELQKRHEGNPRKLQEETSKLYKEEHVNPMSGCLWSLIPFPILIALYQAIRYPLTVMMGVPAALLAEGGAILTKLTDMGFTSTMNAAYIQLNQSQFISENFEAFSGLSDKLVDINYRFLGLNLGEMPQWNFFSKCDWSDTSSWLPALGLFLIPVISALLSWLQTKITQSATPTPAGNEQAGKQMKTMNLMMPLISLYIGFVMPAALGLYWIFNSLLALVQELILNNIYGKQIAAESAAREEKRRLREAEWEQRRQETERLRAEGKTQENENTSKKKQLARQKAELDELKAAAIREERAKRGHGSAGKEAPASQVGNRRYARGRAYVEDRFTNPEDAAEATEAAAEESESWSAEEAAIASELSETTDAAVEAEDADETQQPEEASDESEEDVSGEEPEEESEAPDEDEE